MCVLFSQVFLDPFWEMETTTYTLLIPYSNASLKDFKEVFREPTKHTAVIRFIYSVHLCRLCTLY